MTVKQLLVAGSLASMLVASTGVAYAQVGIPGVGSGKAMRGSHGLGLGRGNDQGQDNSDSMKNKRAMFAFFRGTVSAVNGTTLTVTVGTKSVSVDASNAKFVRRFNGVSTVSELHVGDMVAVRGTWTDSTKTAVIATWVKDVSIQKRHDLFAGTVSSVSSTGFVLNTVNRGAQTVTPDKNTKFYGRKKTAMTLSDVKVGDKVAVRGLWDRTLKTITEVEFVRDNSFPALPTPTASK